MPPRLVRRPNLSAMPDAHGKAIELVIRPPRPEELTSLSALCLRSKAVWGYDANFIEACRAELTLTPAELDDSDIGVAMRGDGVVGLVQVRTEAGEAELEKIFVEPAAIGDGIGRRLFAWAVDRALAAGADRLWVLADPFAAPFYRRMGMADIGTAPSGSIPGRMLPRLTMPLPPAR